jgi:hypothetical protein
VNALTFPGKWNRFSDKGMRSNGSAVPHFRHGPRAGCTRLQRHEVGMIRRQEPGNLRSRIGRRRALAPARIGACVLGACVLGVAFAALAQDARPPVQNPPESPGAPAGNRPATPTPPEAFRPGFIDAVGRWLEEGANKFKSDMQGAQEKFDQFGGQARDAAKEATGAIMALPNARPLTAHERCAPAQNGAPDCQAAALTFCRGKGFQSGKLLDTQSEQKCPTKLLLEGRAPNNTECPTEIFVTRAMCQ